MTTLFLLVGLPGAGKTTHARIAHRRATAPEETLQMSEADILYGRAHFEEPDEAELGGGAIDGPPHGWPTWREWAADQWPSFA
ncbi:hypothetical protein ACFV1B_21280 [Streptomyces sp. NPDC059637]|uniref:hypothetical protein n=1 Tax=Streptomyces sp. NPDC059637 TaxID=3347752 RepID=UPI0036B635D0